MRFQKLMPLAMVATLLIAGICVAQNRGDEQPEPANSKARPADKATNALPEFLTKLNLTAEQEQQIRQVMREHDQKTQKVWSEFHRLHWQTVEAEASLAAANALAGHDHDAHHQTDSKAKNGTRSSDQPGSQSHPSPEQRLRETRHDAVARSQQASGSQTDRPASKNRDHADSATEERDFSILGMRIAVVGPNGVVREIQLAGNVPRHESECEICAAHEKELKSLWAKIHGLHGQLVQIEAERMIAVESKLTEEQINQLPMEHPFQESKQHEKAAAKDSTKSDKQLIERKEEIK